MNTTLFGIILGAATSAGVCAIITKLIDRWDKKHDKADAFHRLVLGLAYDRLVDSCTHCVQRGWITIDEYRDRKKYLYDPYIESGGDGTAERLWKEVEKLPMKEEENV